MEKSLKSSRSLLSRKTESEIFFGEKRDKKVNLKQHLSWKQATCHSVRQLQKTEMGDQAKYFFSDQLSQTNG